MITPDEAPTRTGKVGHLPLVLGITGHRDLRPDDISALEKRFQEVLLDLRTRYPSTPIVLLSPLAEGADRLAARVALANGVKLIVPLPMPVEIYKMDFQDPDSREEFDDLLSQSDLWFELPLIEGNTDALICSNQDSRNQQYVCVGAYIVRHCQILVALWDGYNDEKEGGTSEIVRFMLEGVPEPYGPEESPLDPKRKGPVYHIVTPRIRRSQTNGEPFKLVNKYPSGYSNDEAARDAFDQSHRHVDVYNHETVETCSGMAEARKRNLGYILPEEKRQALSEPLQDLLENYATADTLAQHYQRLTLETLTWLFRLAFASVFFFVLFGENRRNIWLLLVYVITPIPLYFFYNRASRASFQAKHLDYRALAEGLRIQIFWHLAGIHEPVANHYLRKQRSELDWIRDAIASWNIPAEMMPTQRDLKIVQEHWVDDQRKYFQRTAKRDHQRLEKNDWKVKNLFGLGAILTGVLVPYTLLNGWFDKTIGDRTFDLIQAIIMVLIAIFPAIGATLDGYAEKLAFEEQAKQYQRMRDLFETASAQLAAALEAGDDTHAVRVVRELGEEALAENGDWVLIHREREVEVPHAG